MVLEPDICVIGAGSGGLTVAAAAAAFAFAVYAPKRILVPIALVAGLAFGSASFQRL